MFDLALFHSEGWVWVQPSFHYKVLSMCYYVGSYEVKPVLHDGHEFSVCNEADAQAFAVYRRGADGLAAWVADHAFKLDAMRHAYQLAGKDL